MIMRKLNLTILVLSTLVLSSQVFAVSATKIYNGIKEGSLKVVDVDFSRWLEEAQEQLERSHDFHENVSYVFEDINDVQIICNLTDEETEWVRVNSEMETFLAWTKIIKTKSKRTLAYVLKLYADLNWTDAKTKEKKNCKVLRSAYVIDKKRREIDDRELYKAKKITFKDFL